MAELFRLVNYYNLPRLDGRQPLELHQRDGYGILHRLIEGENPRFPKRTSSCFLWGKHTEWAKLNGKNIAD